MHIWSHAFLNDSDSMTCCLEEKIWIRAHEEVSAKRLIAEIRCGRRVVYCAVGSPISTQEGEGEKIYAPAWILAHLGVDGVGEDVDVVWRSEEAFPEATRVLLRPQDSAFYYADAKEELERALTRIGVLQVGTSIAVPLTVLDGFIIQFDVLEAEPANLVLMQGDEVAIEFEGALDGAAESQASPAPRVRPGTPIPEEFSLSDMIPLAAAPAQPGQILGGQSRRMPDGRPWNPWR